MKNALLSSSLDRDPLLTVGQAAKFFGLKVGTLNPQPQSPTQFLLAAALDYADHGRAVVLTYGKKLAFTGPLEQQTFTTKEDALEAFAKVTPAGVGLRTGSAYGVLALDVDNEDDLLKLEAIHGKLPGTWTHSTPTPGHFRLWFKHPPDLKFKTGALSLDGQPQAVELKAENGWSVVPPTAGYVSTNEMVFTSLPETWVAFLKETRAAPSHLKPLADHPDAIKLPAPTEGEARSVLAKIDPDCGYEQWIKMLFAIHSTGQTWAEDVARAWSKGDLRGKQANTFSQTSFNTAWQSATHKSGGVTWGTVLHLAKMAGTAPQLVDAGVFTLKELSETTFEPIHWIIPDLLPAGLFLLSGKPKTGKSWLSLQQVLSIATGGQFFGRKVQQGEALYLALEDNPRRLKSRIAITCGKGPERAYATVEWPNEKAGGLMKLREFLRDNSKVRLVVIDTLARWRSAPLKGESIYHADYQALKGLKSLADEFNIAVVAVTHNSKRRRAEAEDATDLISGSTGLTGGVDGVWVLQRQLSEPRGTLTVIGRDLPKSYELAVEFNDTSGTWSEIGPAAAVGATEEREQVLALIGAAGEPLSRQDIADELEKSSDAVRKLVKRMAKAGLVVETTKGKLRLYDLPKLGKPSTLEPSALVELANQL